MCAPRCGISPPISLEDIQLDDLAAAVGLNPAYLSGLLKNKTGMTYSEHLLKARMERAKELLAGSNAIVKSVCYEVGYRDVKYFSSFSANIRE